MLSNLFHMIGNRGYTTDRVGRSAKLYLHRTDACNANNSELTQKQAIIITMTIGKMNNQLPIPSPKQTYNIKLTKTRPQLTMPLKSYNIITVQRTTQPLNQINHNNIHHNRLTSIIKINQNTRDQIVGNTYRLCMWVFHFIFR